jgi:hypothetical protein
MTVLNLLALAIVFRIRDWSRNREKTRQKCDQLSCQSYLWSCPQIPNWYATPLRSIRNLRITALGEFTFREGGFFVNDHLAHHGKNLMAVISLVNLIQNRGFSSHSETSPDANARPVLKNHKKSLNLKLPPPDKTVGQQGTKSPCDIFWR